MEKNSDRGLIFLQFFRLSCHWNVYCYLWCRWEKLLPMVSFFLPLVQFSNQKQEFLPMVRLWCCNNYVGKSYFDIRNPIWTFELSWKMLFWYSKSYFVIQTERDNRIFYIQNPILTFEMSRKIVFWHSKSYFDIRTESENRNFTFEILFWHSNWVGKSYFDIQNPFSTFELSRKMLS